MRGKVYQPMCSGCPHDLYYSGSIPQKQFGVMMHCGEHFCTGGKRARRFKKSDPKIHVPAWCPKRKTPCEVRIYGPKSVQDWLLQCAFHDDGISDPSAHRYAMRTQGTTELSSYEFWKRCEEEPVAEWFPFKLKQFEVLEIDDGLNPTYFYYVDGDFVSVCLFDGETARKNVYKGSGDFQE